ncbi:hypothetical protein [Notoacmeibacter sp. MSK16QG-6]|uniref:hypothetical protein n=1 Tax=Notoacmeibacter sp. MSK16QG-6 TaxID=2957982 RepID=UPI00209E4517|nr:hypothetical protein [Notoacmeibacter sp. MSK16QG-6]MCP1198076.1 hypothetical protein [Notoacmeibacter sp. MSK16QG-6]
MKYLFLGVALAAMPVSAMAEDCSCVASSGVVVSAVQGDVHMTGQDGLVSVRPGTTLAAGSRLTTGEKSTAQLSGAGCELSVTPNTDVDVLPATAGGLCVASASVLSLPQVEKNAAYGQTLNGSSAGPILALGGGIIVAGIIAAGASAFDDDDDASD